jgi:hypothetical protein
MLHRVADAASLAALFEGLRADQRPPVVALRDPGSVAQDWSKQVGAAPALDPLGPLRGHHPEPLWLHDGPGALVLADQRSAYAALDPGGPATLLTGRAARGGVAGLVTLAQGPGGEQQGHPCVLEPTSDGGSVFDALVDGDLFRACVLAEQTDDGPERTVAEVFRAVYALRRDDATRAAFSLAEPSWRAIALGFIGLADGQMTAVRLLLRSLVDAAHPTIRALARPTAALCGEPFAPVPGEATWLREVDGRATARSALGQCHRDNDLLGRVRLGHHPTADLAAAPPVRAGYEGLQRALEDLRTGVPPADVVVPPPDAVGPAAKVSLLLEGRRAFQMGDRVAIRRLSAALHTVMPWPAVQVDLAASMALEGPDWERLIWLRALRELPDAAPHTDAIERRIAEVEARILAISDYVLQQKLAQGAFGVVWQAVHEPTGSPVAIKLMKGGTPRDLERFEREIDVVASLVHPAIAAVLDRGVVTEPLPAAGVAVGDPYLVMELVSGGTLASAPEMVWNDIFAVTMALLDALAYAHARGVLHRDIKPATVLLAEAGTIRLADFGLAALPQRGTVAGTPVYMAPEQLRGNASMASDLYAMGALLWTLLTGAPPWLGTAKTLLAVDRSRLPTFEPRVAVPRGLVGVLETALASNPRRRFASAADFAAALSELGAPDREAVSDGGRSRPQAFVLPTLLDFTPLEEGDEPTVTTVPLGRVFGGEGTLRWRPRLPTTGLFDAGDPPLLFRERAQQALWQAWMRAFSGRTVRVEIAGPEGSGRRSLLRWLRRKALRLGMRVGSSPGAHPAIIEADPTTPVASFSGPEWAACLVVWVRPPTGPPPPIRIALTRFTPMQVFWIVRSRIGVSGDMALDVAGRSAGRPTHALAALRDALHDPGLAPGPEGLVPLRDNILAPGPHEHAAWRQTLDALEPPERRAWAGLAGQLLGFTDTQCREGVAALGLPAVDPAELATRSGDRWRAVPAVVELLRGEARASDVVAIHDIHRPVHGDGADRVFAAILRRDASALREAIADLDPICEVPFALVEEAFRVASQEDVLDPPTWDHLQLLASNSPAWIARQAMGGGNPGFAARAWAHAVHRSKRVEQPTLSDVRALLDRLPVDGEDWLVAAWLFLQINIWAPERAEEALALAGDIEASTHRGWPWWAAKTELALGGSVHRTRDPDGLVQVARAARDAGYVGRANRIAKLAVQMAYENERPDVAGAACALFTAANPTGAVPAALHLGLSGRIAEMKPVLERSLCTLRRPADWRGYAFLLLLGTETDAHDPRWNDLCELAKPLPSEPIALLLRQLARRADHLPERRQVLLELAQRCDVRFA